MKKKKASSEQSENIVGIISGKSGKMSRYTVWGKERERKIDNSYVE